MYHLGFENRRSKGRLTLCTHRRGAFETALGVAKSPEGCDAVSRQHKLTPLTPHPARCTLPVGKSQRAGVTRGDLSDSVEILINIRRLTLRSQFCFDKTFIGSQDRTLQ